MTTAAIKKKLHNYLEIADSKKLKAIYTMVEDDINESMMEEYTPEYKAELDSRLAEYREGKSKTVTPAELKKRTQKLMRQGKKK